MVERGDRRSEQKRREILSAARTLFASEGYADTGMEVVARMASVSTATLYAHFPSKTDLFRAVVMGLVAEAADGIYRGAPEAEAHERLLAFAKAYGGFCNNPGTRAVVRMACAERRRFEDGGMQVEVRSRQEIGGVAIRMIQQLADSGQLKVEKASWAAGQLLGMIEHSTLLYGLVNGDGAQARRPLDEICEDAVTTFLARYGVRETAG
ncbi:MAG: TetR/AcrR family transcriptional regulator [Ignavibacteriales bacterium]